MNLLIFEPIKISYPFNMYIWQFKNWPNFTYSVERLTEIAVAFAEAFGAVNGLMAGLNKELQQETLLEMLIEEAIKTSEIEGEYLSRADVMSSIKNSLGLHQCPAVKDKRASGIASLMVEVNQQTTTPFTLNLLRHWHQVLMEHNLKVNPGLWRQGEAPMQIVSGASGREIVHYEAPPSDTVDAEMEQLIKWYNDSALPVKDNISKALLKSAIVHLHFESIHPFEDGNGRVGRAMAAFTLRQNLNAPVLLSLSKTIEKNRKLYYAELKAAQSSMDITSWVEYFARVILEAQEDAKMLVEFTLKKAKFFDEYKHQLNERQLKVIIRMLAEGTAGFTGGMTAKKYMVIAKTSKATATRDLQQLNEIGVFMIAGAGRSVRYQLAL